MNRNETRLGLSPEPEHTCPMIDAGLRSLDEIDQAVGWSARRLRDFHRDELEDINRDIAEGLGDIENASSWVRDAFESARNNAGAIREWGFEWKAQALYFERELEDLRQRYNLEREQHTKEIQRLIDKLTFTIRLPSWRYADRWERLKLVLDFYHWQFYTVWEKVEEQRLTHVT